MRAVFSPAMEHGMKAQGLAIHGDLKHLALILTMPICRRFSLVSSRIIAAKHFGRAVLMETRPAVTRPGEQCCLNEIIRVLTPCMFQV